MIEVEPAGEAGLGEGVAAVAGLDEIRRRALRAQAVEDLDDVAIVADMRKKGAIWAIATGSPARDTMSATGSRLRAPTFPLTRELNWRRLTVCSVGMEAAMVELWTQPLRALDQMSWMRYWWPSMSWL